LGRLTFIGLFSNADDSGRGRAKASYIKSIVYPYDEAFSAADIDGALEEIARHMSISFYQKDGNEYYELLNWTKWQKVDKPVASKLPSMAEATGRIRSIVPDLETKEAGDSATIRGSLPSNGIEENTDTKKRKASPKPECTEDDLFETFWQAYPRKEDKKGAKAAWASCVRPKEVPRIMAALFAMKLQRQWTEQNGKFIPYAVRFLRQERWKDVDVINDFGDLDF